MEKCIKSNILLYLKTIGEYGSSLASFDMSIRKWTFKRSNFSSSFSNFFHFTLIARFSPSRFSFLNFWNYHLDRIPNPKHFHVSQFELINKNNTLNSSGKTNAARKIQVEQSLIVVRSKIGNQRMVARKQFRGDRRKHGFSNPIAKDIVLKMVRYDVSSLKFWGKERDRAGSSTDWIGSA